SNSAIRASWPSRCWSAWKTRAARSRKVTFHKAGRLGLRLCLRQTSAGVCTPVRMSKTTLALNSGVNCRRCFIRGASSKTLSLHSPYASVQFSGRTSSSPQNLIVGKWEAGESGLKLTAEFTKDGKAKLTMFRQTLRGTYRLNGDELEWTLNGKTTKMKVKVAVTEMAVTSERKSIKIKRI